MPRVFRRLLCVFLPIFLLAGVAQASRPLYRLDAASSFDPYANETAWIKAHVDLLKGYGSFAREHYVNKGIPTIDYHDAATEGFTPLTPENRTRYMKKVEEDKAQGFVGVFNDDVNFGTSFRDGNQNKTSYEPEAKELGALIVQERAFWPQAIIESNTQWHDLSARLTDPSVEQMIANSTLITKEFGVGPTAGITTTSDYESLLGFIESLHPAKHIVLTGDFHNANVPTMEYNEATYFLTNEADYLNVPGEFSLPPTFWAGNSVDPGEPIEPRFTNPEGLLVRVFTHGISVVNPPGHAERTLSLGCPYKSVEWGGPITKVTLKSSQGAVLTEDGACW